MQKSTCILIAVFGLVIGLILSSAGYATVYSILLVRFSPPLIDFPIYGNFIPIFYFVLFGLVAGSSLGSIPLIGFNRWLILILLIFFLSTYAVDENLKMNSIDHYSKLIVLLLHAFIGMSVRYLFPPKHRNLNRTLDPPNSTI